MHADRQKCRLVAGKKRGGTGGEGAKSDVVMSH